MWTLFSYPVQLLLSYGYTALFIWSIFEGELGLMLAGWLASEGRVFSYPHILAVAIVGALIGDMVLYSLGRVFGRSMEKWLLQHYREKQRKVEMWFRRWGAWVVVFERFVYGTHIPALLTVGMSGFAFPRFLLFDIIGVVLWASTFVTIGFCFGRDAIHIILFAQRNLPLVLFVIFVLIIYKKMRKSP